MSKESPKRVFVAGLFHETHAFLDEFTELDDFEVLRVDQILDRCGDSSTIGGALQVFRDHAWQVEPSITYTAVPSGPVRNNVFESFWREIESFWKKDFDAVFLVLHGAMSTTLYPDAEGELLKRIRQRLPNGEHLPIFGVYDLHANFSPDMAEYANALIAYRENPHTDAKESAIRAAEMLVRCVERGDEATMVYQPTDYVWAPAATGTADPPMKRLETLARSMEERNEHVLAVNVNAGFAHSDSPHTGLSFQIITTEKLDTARLLSQLCDAAHEANQLVKTLEQPFDVVLKRIRKEPIDGLTVLVEPSDNIGGGAPGDCTGLLREVLASDLENTAVCINDPAAVESVDDLSPGDRVVIKIGGKGSRFDEGPLELDVELISKSGGRFQLEDPNSHLASMSGDEFDMGSCAVVRHKSITILLTSRKTPPFDLGQWRSQSIEPTEFDFVIVKAAVAHRRAYDPITEKMFWVDTPGPCRIVTNG